jgi:RNA polymerase sigma factor (sigma-70 family)
MIWSILQNYSGISKEDREDLKQEVMFYLWNHVMPQYDESKGAKFSSFAYRCAVNFINRKLYSSNRKRLTYTKTIETLRDTEKEYYEEECSITSEKIDMLKDLIDDDNGPFKDREKIVMIMMIDRPSITQKEIADTMGYRHPSAISMMMSRIRKKIRRALRDLEM